MTEVDWLKDDNPVRMLQHIVRHATSRKRRLFACACFRHVPLLFDSKQILEAIETCERFADDLATKKELAHAYNPPATPARDPLFEKYRYLLPTPRNTEEVRACAARIAKDGFAERNYQARILRCLFGNPFDRLSAGTHWMTETVNGLAKAIYAERAFDRLPILADALEDAGCTNADVLSHCREPGEHVRGCWVVDLLLAKQ